MINAGVIATDPRGTEGHGTEPRNRASNKRGALKKKLTELRSKIRRGRVHATSTHATKTQGAVQYRTAINALVLAPRFSAQIAGLIENELEGRFNMSSVKSP